MTVELSQAANTFLCVYAMVITFVALNELTVSNAYDLNIRAELKDTCYSILPSFEGACVYLMVQVQYSMVLPFLSIVWS